MPRLDLLAAVALIGTMIVGFVSVERRGPPGAAPAFSCAMCLGAAYCCIGGPNPWMIVPLVVFAAVNWRNVLRAGADAREAADGE